jgi:hypothetical protein
MKHILLFQDFFNDAHLYFPKLRVKNEASPGIDIYTIG